MTHLHVLEAAPDGAGKGAICEAILRRLPDWFGIEASIRAYVRDVERMPMLLARAEDGAVVGFLAWRHHFPWSAEIHVMGVLPEHHRRGVGRRLVGALVERLEGEGCELLQVKTLGPSRACLEYERTRAFYDSMGFRPLEEIPAIWGEANPCLVMVRHVAPARSLSP